MTGPGADKPVDFAVDPCRATGGRLDTSSRQGQDLADRQHRWPIRDQKRLNHLFTPHNVTGKAEATTTASASRGWQCNPAMYHSLLGSVFEQRVHLGKHRREDVRDGRLEGLPELGQIGAS